VPPTSVITVAAATRSAQVVPLAESWILALTVSFLPWARVALARTTKAAPLNRAGSPARSMSAPLAAVLSPLPPAVAAVAFSALAK
jgi:hypothetical protein